MFAGALSHSRHSFPNMNEIKLTQFSHGGGCGCKIAPGVLSELLATMPAGLIPPDLLVGTDTADDAAVYRLNDRQAVVATTDFFTPIVDNPRDFGRIAATNALSDVYAMGGMPIFALAVVGMPLDKLPREVIGEILQGGAEVCREAGIPFELRRISRNEVLAADELLLSSATKEVLAITRLDGRPVGKGVPGPICQKLHAGYQRAKQESTS